MQSEYCVGGISVCMCGASCIRMPCRLACVHVHVGLASPLFYYTKSYLYFALDYACFPLFIAHAQPTSIKSLHYRGRAKAAHIHPYKESAHSFYPACSEAAGGSYDYFGAGGCVYYI